MSENPTIPLNEQECQQDILQRVHKWLNVLEERVMSLLQAHEPEALKPGECEQAISRHLILMLRLLQLRQQYVQKRTSKSEQGALDAFLRSLEEVDGL